MNHIGTLSTNHGALSELRRIFSEFQQKRALRDNEQSFKGTLLEIG